jgi:hypothetical protein
MLPPAEQEINVQKLARRNNPSSGIKNKAIPVTGPEGYRVVRC